MQSLERARPIWPILAAVVLSFGLLVASGAARGQSQSNPTAQAVTEQQLLQELNRIQGRITIPDDKAAILQQPQGRDYQSFHEDALPWIGGIAVLRSEEHTSELQSLMRISYAVFCLKKQKHELTTP